MSGAGPLRATIRMAFTFGAGPSNVTRESRSDEGINGRDGKALDGMMNSPKTI
jgi:hypothetical protein